MEQKLKPVFKEEIKFEITEIGKIEDNISKVKEFAFKLKDYYSKLVYNEESYKEAKEDKANVNKFKKQISDYRKKVTTEWNKPIDKSISEAKETEKILSDIYNGINTQVNAYDDAKKEEKKQEIETYFEELKIKENIDFVDFDKANINVTLSASVKSLKEQAKDFINHIANDVKTIETQEYQDEILIEYKKTLDLNNSIQIVVDRHKELEKVQQVKAENKEQEITDEEMLNKIDSLSAPKVEEKELLEGAFVVRVDDENCFREIKQVGFRYGAEIKTLIKKGDVYYEQ